MRKTVPEENTCITGKVIYRHKWFEYLNIRFSMATEFFSIFITWRASNQSILSLKLASTKADLIPFPFGSVLNGSPHIFLKTDEDWPNLRKNYDWTFKDPVSKIWRSSFCNFLIRYLMLRLKIWRHYFLKHEDSKHAFMCWWPYRGANTYTPRSN